MTVQEAVPLLREMQGNTDHSLSGTQVIALALATVVLSALQPIDVKTVNAIFQNYFD